MNRKHIFLSLFFLTGLVGVLAEQVFERLLSSVIGGSTPASAMVLVAYFAGFSVGGYGAARLLKSHRINPLRAYGWAELGVAICCVAVLASFDRAIESYAPFLAWAASSTARLMLARAAVAASVVFPAAFCMGLSFPCLSELTSRLPEQPAAFLAQLYAVNLLGAAFAALAAPYWIFPHTGLAGGLAVCAVVDIVVGLVAVSMSMKLGTVNAAARPALVAATSARLEARHMPILTIAFLSGLTFFSLEVVWTHLVGVVINASTYAFGSMLFFVILGLGLGSSAVAKRLGRNEACVSLGSLYLACALLLLAQSFLWPYIPLSLAMFGHSIHSFYLGEMLRWSHLALLLIPVTFAYGMIYPSLFQERHFDRGRAGALIGYMGAFNAIGCVCGAAIASFVLIPRLGAENSLKAGAVALAVCGAVMQLIDRESRRFNYGALTVAAVALVAAGAPGWNRLLLTCGLNVYFRADSVLPSSELLFFHEDSQGGVTTVVENMYPNGVKGRVLLTNGKFQGMDAGLETYSQLGFTSVPAMHLANLQDALVIGFGSGHTAGMLRLMGFKSIDIAELAPGIVSAAHQHFSVLNKAVLDAPGTTVYFEDGRNLLLTRAKQYDLISIEITSIWISGETNVYSQGFYTTARQRLKPGGLLQQWVQLHHISPAEVESIIGTVRSVFPYVSLWTSGGQGIILASDHRHKFEEPGSQAVMRALVADLGPDDQLPQRAYDELRRSVVLECDDVDQLMRAAKPRINTDWNRYLEYATPRYNLSNADWPRINLERLAAYASAARPEKTLTYARPAQ